MFEAPGASADAAPSGPPRAPRKNVMLAATISAGTVSAPVRIRNLSEVGAMIDGPALPGAGVKLTLSRLALSIGATVVWSRNGRCGLSLGCPIIVDDWITGVASAPNITVAAAGQARVDRLQAAIRSGAPMPAETRAPAAVSANTQPVERRIAAELRRVKQILDEVSDELTDDVGVLTRHERAMQNFDIAAMIVEELAVVLAAEDREAAVGSVQMHDLRTRLSGRLTLT